VCVRACVCVMEVTCTNVCSLSHLLISDFQIYFLLFQKTNDNKCDISIISNSRKKLEKSLEENSQPRMSEKIVTCMTTKYIVTLRTPCTKINGMHCY
jgi:hypothetical protein